MGRYVNWLVMLGRATFLLFYSSARFFNSARFCFVMGNQDELHKLVNKQKPHVLPPPPRCRDCDASIWDAKIVQDA